MYYTSFYASIVNFEQVADIDTLIDFPVLEE